MILLKWGFIFRSNENYMDDFASHWRDREVHIWKNEPGHVSTEYTFASPHFSTVPHVNDLMDRAIALKAIFDGAMTLDVLPNGRFDTFQFGLIVELPNGKRHDRPTHGNVLVEPFDKFVPPILAPEIDVEKRYQAEEMISQAKFDPVAKGMLKHVGYNGPDFRTLYSLLDWMEAEGWSEAKVAAVTGQKAADVNLFTHTANNETVLGPMARHGKKLGWQPPAVPMTLKEAQSLILPAAKAFLKERAKAFADTGHWPSFVPPTKSKKQKASKRRT